MRRTEKNRVAGGEGPYANNLIPKADFIGMSLCGLAINPSKGSTGASSALSVDDSVNWEPC